MQGIPAVGARWIYWGLTLVALAASSAAIVRHALPLWYELIALALGSTGHQAACGILTRPARALLPPAAATAQFAKDTGKSCGDCHTNPQGGGLAGVNYFFRWRLSFLPVLSLHHWSTIAQSDAKGVRSSVSEIC